MSAPDASPPTCTAAVWASGASGLIYQVVWVREFGNVFGNTITLRGADEDISPTARVGSASTVPPAVPSTSPLN